MEAGTFGLILIAVGVLMGDSEIPEMPQPLMRALESIGPLDQISSETIFVWLIFCAIGLQIIKSGTEYLGSVGAIRLTKRASRHLQKIVLDNILAEEYQFIARYPTGVLGALITQADVVAQKLIVRIFNAGVLSLIMLGVYVFFLNKISIPLTFTALAVVAVLSLLGRVVRRLKTLGRQSTQNTLEHGNLFVDYLNSVWLIKTRCC